ncbi:hypothetical protein BDW59DRAFT_166442 [Aspergillus cavernicola]|uniref:Response regulatory domain-containing protein n=1 Tax=Aspergillus cavernicola TaxID=176166 RepID=A0ABR4HL72_9EURO
MPPPTARNEDLESWTFLDAIPTPDDLLFMYGLPDPDMMRRLDGRGSVTPEPSEGQPSSTSANTSPTQHGESPADTQQNLASTSPNDEQSAADTQKTSTSNPSNGGGAACPTENNPSRPRLNILLAGDDSASRDFLQWCLELLRHTVHLAQSGIACAADYEQNLWSFSPTSYDAILIDLSLSGSDDWDTPEVIRGSELTAFNFAPDTQRFGNSPPRIPIFALFKSANRINHRRCMNAGFDGWFTEPIDLDRLKIILSGVGSDELRNQNLVNPGMWHGEGWYQR